MDHTTMLTELLNVTNEPDISIVIPVYNEEMSVSRLTHLIHNTCEQLGKPYEVIFVDDGSQDRTPEVLESVHQQDARVHVIRFRKNFGQTAAMAAGFWFARGAVIISMDGDLQNDPADIPSLLAKLDEGYDVVCGWRKERKDKWLSRRLPSVIANCLIYCVTGVPIHDNGCSLKAYRAEVIKRVTLYAELHRFIPAMSTLTGARITEIEVRHHARQFGQSKYGLSRVWRVLLDLMLVKMLTRFSSRPALWFGILSLPGFLGGMICLLGLLLPANSGVVLPSLAFLCFSLVGHLVTLGVLGEMVVQTGDFHPSQMLVGTTIQEMHVLRK
jgi:glycosyltransferase involved in cell wall biosynthesis